MERSKINNIKNFFKLNNTTEAIQELLKGKNTTLKERHSGEGIFFTSKIADSFKIESHETVLSFSGGVPKIMKNKTKNKGTKVFFSIQNKSTKNIQKLFEFFTNKDYKFDTTVLYIKVFEVEAELISRSQAKRLLENLDRFSRVILDFTDVEYIGQAFADEIFRVYKLDYPNIHFEYKNAIKDVEFMIKRATS